MNKVTSNLPAFEAENAEHVKDGSSRLEADLRFPKAMTPKKHNGNSPENDLPHRSVFRSSDTNTKQKTAVGFRLLLVMGIVAIAGWQMRDRVAGWWNPPETTPAALTDDEIKSVFALGRLEPEGEVISVAGPSGSGDARIESLKAVVGQRVQRGDVLAELDNRPRLKAGLKVAETRVEQARWQLAQARIQFQTRREELVASMEARQAEKELAALALARRKKLLSSDAVSREEYENFAANVTTTAKVLREAEARLARYEEDLEQSVDVQLAKSDVSVAEASLQEARTRLDDSLIRAPVTGTILDMELRVGERVSNASLLKMGRTDSMLVRAEVYESDVSKIVTGQDVVVRASALDRPLTGKVETIASFVQKQSVVEADPAANTDARVVEVFVRLDEGSASRGSRFVGMQVRVEFQR
ncbi:MAG: HlyD family efflux transporter periplasmic adaptor subunit [Planctomycetota bacterium]